jgi:IS5 family transposase
MRPARPGRASPDLFRDRLDAIINMKHLLIRLAETTPRSEFDESFGQ